MLASVPLEVSLKPLFGRTPTTILIRNHTHAHHKGIIDQYHVLGFICPYSPYLLLAWCDIAAGVQFMVLLILLDNHTHEQRDNEQASHDNKRNHEAGSHRVVSSFRGKASWCCIHQHIHRFRPKLQRGEFKQQQKAVANIVKVAEVWILPYSAM